jgi:hypothetical protein
VASGVLASLDGRNAHSLGPNRSAFGAPRDVVQGGEAAVAVGSDYSLAGLGIKFLEGLTDLGSRRESALVGLVDLSVALGLGESLDSFRIDSWASRSMISSSALRRPALLSLSSRRVFTGSTMICLTGGRISAAL